MAQNKLIRIGPVSLSATLGTDILSPPTSAGGAGLPAQTPHVTLKHVRIVNRTGSAASFSLWLGSSGANVAGTEVIGIGKSISANDAFDWYGLLKIKAGEYLVGGASVSNALTFEAEAEIGFD